MKRRKKVVSIIPYQTCHYLVKSRNMEGLLALLQNQIKFEPPHDKTNKTACAPIEDSDQPGHLPSLTSVFAVRMKKAWVLSYSLSAQRRL